LIFFLGKCIYANRILIQAFTSLKELSNHMVKNSHYKEHIMRSITESGSRRRQSREKRKKSLPVRKLLELERANQEMKKEIRISCEKCSEKIPGPLFVEHLRICGNTDKFSHSGSGASSGSSSPLKQPTPSPKLDGHHDSRSHSEPAQDLSLGVKDKSDDKNESSAINAIEKMIEKSFDYRTAARTQVAANLGPSPPIGTRYRKYSDIKYIKYETKIFLYKTYNKSSFKNDFSILKRLGIDESVDYTKPLLDTSMLPIPPNKYSPMPPRSRRSSVSSDKSEDAANTIRSHSNISKSNSNSSSPALLPDDNSIKSPLSLTANTKSPSAGSPANSTDPDNGALSDDNHSEKVKNSHRSNQINNKPNKKHSHNNSRSQSSLSALSSMFESIGGGGGGGGGDNNSSGKNNSASGGFPSNSHHPLAALQKLCDKTENTPGAGGNGAGGGGERGSANSRPTSTSSSNPQSSPGTNFTIKQYLTTNKY
jgi:teashirt-like protein